MTEEYKIQYVDLAQQKEKGYHGRYGFHAYVGSVLNSFDGWGENKEEARKEVIRHIEDSLAYHKQQVEYLQKLYVENL